MKVAIFHYHLNPGGVTRIIQSQVTSLGNYVEKPIKVITGNCPSPELFEYPHIELIIEPKLDYLTYKPDKRQFEHLYKYISQFVNDHLSDNTIIHFHNLNLGKNPVVTKVFSDLAKAGWNIVNHCHDFAEDRPKNMQFYQDVLKIDNNSDLSHILYPDIKNYHFCTLNMADYQRLDELKISHERRYLLPNPVWVNESQITHDQFVLKSKICKKLGLEISKKIITYPVRVIRRKNIGEMILLATLFKDEANWVVTQPPKNPVEIEDYNKWLEFCEQHHVSIHFEAGTKVDFDKLIFASDYCITTSYQEGFGMAFLEPWLFGVPVIGRDIPYITPDFLENGIQFPGLYTKLIIHFNGKERDFIEFDDETKRKIIAEAIQNTQFVKDIFTTNPFLLNLLSDLDPNLIEKNRQIIKEEYSIEKYGERLYELYKRVIGEYR